MSYTSGITRFFTIGITSSGSRSIATRCWKARCGSGYERLSGRCAKNWTSGSYPAFSREHVHMFVEIPPHIAVSDFVRRVKGRSWTGPDGVPGLAQALLGAAFLGLGLLLHHERQHHGRCHTSVSSGARTYRRQPVVIQFIACAGKHELGPVRGTALLYHLAYS